MEKLLAPVNKIIPFSIVDGVGNRTAIFFQGCNFNCLYCHNPETRKICVGCGACISVCPVGALSKGPSFGKGKTTDFNNPPILYDYKKCIGCDACIKTCPHDASPKIRYMDTDSLLVEIKNQVPFIRGITVSGGECSLYIPYLKELFKKTRELGLTNFMDTNGGVPLFDEELLEVTDAFMLDIKAFKKDDHLKVAEIENSTVIKNLRFLAQKNKLYEVRTVVVPDLYDVEHTIRETVKILKEFGQEKRVRYKIIKYRSIGVREKYKSLTSPDDKYLETLKDLAISLGQENVIVV